VVVIFLSDLGDKIVIMEIIYYLLHVVIIGSGVGDGVEKVVLTCGRWLCAATASDVYMSDCSSQASKQANKLIATLSEFASTGWDPRSLLWSAFVARSVQ
jgi:hypothetical protein